MAITADWLSAIATAAAVAVATVALVPQILSWWNRPNLTTEFENKPPFCTYSNVDVTAISIENEQQVSRKIKSNGYFLRVRIRNNGGSTARNVQVKMIRVLDPATLKEPQNVRFDPSVLNWAPPPHDKVSLNKKDFDFVDVIQVVQVNPVLGIYALERRPEQNQALRGLTFDLPRGTYLLDVSVYAKNAEPIQRRYRLTCGKAWDDVKLEQIATAISD